MYRHAIGPKTSRSIRRTLASSIHDPYNALISIRKSPKLREGPLSSLTWTAKDNIATTEEPTTCASKILSNYYCPFDATVVKLLDEAGAKLLGKNNLDEFGMGSSNTNSAFGPVKNPLYEEFRVAGGSSGGSAAAVAGGICDFSLGTDTGGSVRQPASYCGIIGFKPTYGRISRWGVVAYAQGFDTVGILARDFAVVRKTFEVIDKYDDKDITSMPSWIRSKFGAARLPKKLRIGVPREFIVGELLLEAKKEYSATLENLMKAGHSIVPVSLPSIKKSLPAYYTLVSASAASTLSRFDGVRYGTSVGPEYPETIISDNRANGLGMEVKRRTLLGNFTLSSESGDHFVRATGIRQQLVEEMNDVLAFPNHLLDTPENPDGVHVLVAPTAFGEAPTIEEYTLACQSSLVNGYINDIMTIPASLAGCPSISVPMRNRRYGLQVMTQYGYDQFLLKAAELIEAHK